MFSTMVLPLVERIPAAPLTAGGLLTAGAEPLPQENKGKVSPMVLNTPLLTLTVTGPAAEMAPDTASGADAVLVTLKNWRFAPLVVPKVSAPGVRVPIP